MIVNEIHFIEAKKNKSFYLFKKILALTLSALILQPMVISNTSAATALTGRANFLWGMTVHSKGYVVYPESKLEEHVRLTAELGSKIMRFNFNPISFSDYEYLDTAVLLCKDYGLEMMLVLDAFSLYNTQQEFETYHAIIAKRYKGKIKYYQIFNELDVYCMHLDNGDLYNNGDGSTINQYNPQRLEEVTPKLLGSINAFRINDPEAKLVVNFAYKHTAILQYFMDNGAQWDIIGHDWYSDMEAVSSVTGVFDELIQKHPAYDIMICETNIWAYTPYTEDQQSDFMASFIKTVYDYDSPKIIGLIFYELLDEPQFEPTTAYNGEAHFGFVKCDITGDNLVKKKAFTTIQNIIGKEAVLFAKCDGTEGLIFHPGGLSGNIRTLSASNNLWENTYRVMPGSRDLTGCNTLTYSMYISDQAAFDEWKNHMSFVIGSGNSFYTWPMRQNLVYGWNNISLDLTPAVAAGVDISAVTEVTVKSHYANVNDFSTDYNFNSSWMDSTIDLTILLKEIYGRKISLGVSFAKCDGTEGPIFEPGGFSGSERTLSASNNLWENTYRVVPGSRDLTGCNTLIYDMYISDKAAYDEWKNHMSFVIGSGNSFYTWPMRQDLVYGWNNITLDLTPAVAAGVDISAVTEVIVKSHHANVTDFSIDYNFNSSWMDSTMDLTILLKEIYGRYRVLVAKCDGTEGAIFHPGGFTGNDRTFSSSNNLWENNYIVVPLVAKDLSGCNTLTLDMYISDQAAFDEWKNHMSFIIGNGTTFYSWPMRQDLVIGYNSISLSLAPAIASGMDLSVVESVSVKSHYNETITDYSTDFNFNSSWMNSTQNLSIALKEVYGRAVPISFGNYKITETVITNVSVGTSVSDCLSVLAPGVGVSSVFTNSIGTITGAAKIGTDTKVDITIDGQTTRYAFVIYGDVSGDGQVGIADLAAMKSHLLSIEKLGGKFFTAGDLQSNNSISISGLLSVKKQILGISNINQNS